MIIDPTSSPSHIFVSHQKKVYFSQYVTFFFIYTILLNLYSNKYCRSKMRVGLAGLPMILCSNGN